MNEEQTEANKKSLIDEIEGYGQHQSIYAANRDGDLFYIECPSCHSTDLNTKRIMSCRKCHTHFSLYLEDGFQTFPAITQSGSINPLHGGNEIKLAKLKPGDYFLTNILGRNVTRIDELKAKYPDLKIVKLGRDLSNGTDAHGHAEYKRFVLIPLD